MSFWMEGKALFSRKFKNLHNDKKALFSIAKA